MSFQIEVLKVNVENKGKFKQALVSYKTSDGKVVDGKKVMSFSDSKGAFDVLSNAKQGDVFTITSGGAPYFNWINATPGSKALETANTVAKSGRSNFETPDERAARQVYIVRQSSISNALQYYELSGTKGLTVEGVLSLAKTFEDFVFNGVKEELKNVEVV